MITALTKRIKLLAELLHKETVYSSEAKIANLIYTDPTIFERLKNNEIASILNITPETLSGILSKLKKEKIIEINEHVVMVFDKNRLKHIISTNQLD